MDNKQRHFILDLMSESLDNLKDNQDPFIVCLNIFAKLGQLIDEDIDNEYASHSTGCESTSDVLEPSL